MSELVLYKGQNTGIAIAMARICNAAEANPIGRKSKNLIPWSIRILVFGDKVLGLLAVGVRIRKCPDSKYSHPCDYLVRYVQ